MIKHILVPTDGSETARRSAHYAISLARHYGAVVHGLHVVDIKLLEGPFLRDLSASLGTAPYVNYQGNIGMLLDERGKFALEAVAKACTHAGVQCETMLESGLVARTIVEKSDLVDLIVLGRGGEHNEWLDGLLGSTTEAVVRRTNRPVLVTGREEHGAARYLVAYDGSQHAKHALHVAAEISASWGAPLTVVVVGDERAAALLEEAQAYLSAHDLKADYTARPGDPGETLVSIAEELRADLLVMGAFGHNKVRELVVGSTTSFVLNHSPCPILLTR